MQIISGNLVKNYWGGAECRDLLIPTRLLLQDYTNSHLTMKNFKNNKVLALEQFNIISNVC